MEFHCRQSSPVLPEHVAQRGILSTFFLSPLHKALDLCPLDPKLWKRLMINEHIEP